MDLCEKKIKNSRLLLLGSFLDLKKLHRKVKTLKRVHHTSVLNRFVCSISQQVHIAANLALQTPEREL